MFKGIQSLKLGLLIAVFFQAKVWSGSGKELSVATTSGEEAFHTFKNLPIDNEAAPESERVSAFVVRLEKIKQFLSLLETWKKEIESSTTLTSEQKTQFNDAFTKVTSKSIDGAMEDVKAAKPNFEKAKIVRSSVVVCSRIHGAATKAAREAAKAKNDAAKALQVKDKPKEAKKDEKAKAEPAKKDDKKVEQEKDKKAEPIKDQKPDDKKPVTEKKEEPAKPAAQDKDKKPEVAKEDKKTEPSKQESGKKTEPTK